MKKYSLINLIISSLITSQIVIVANAVKAEPINSLKPILTAQKTQELTEELITTVMTSIENAEKEENLAQILNFLCPYIISSITVESEETTTTKVIEGKQSHENFLKNNFNRIKQREYINSYRTTKIAEDGQMATVTRIRATNIISENGEKYLSVSTDKIHFALIDNEPKIINLEVKGWLEERP
ncbi:hypothetical protein GM3708_686 [Geminocystis sp. NIES-3708]|uniref:hypothetical protein n=1 Tax=Geminocystis sp. NIES-3708 TaxID=1615909 RepID=UPI0005FCD626|nr:hypothetical protein [Geminocystis sp. NIES-3708]BAQ60280.1 hypothetical protein GM3708_686 [Geminocystis sp. NIES-3708]